MVDHILAQERSLPPVSVAAKVDLHITAGHSESFIGCFTKPSFREADLKAPGNVRKWTSIGDGAVVCVRVRER
jgi:hypothetical protein